MKSGLVQSSFLLAVFVILTFTATPTYGTDDQTPDFIIVGAGNAGSVLAGRLCTSLPSAKIVLLERGNQRNQTEELLVRAARHVFSTWTSSSLTEVMATNPDPTLLNRSLITFTGRTLGGTTSINAGQYTLPKPGTISSWGFRRLTERRVRNLFRRVRKTTQFRAPPRESRESFVYKLLKAMSQSGIPYTSRPFSGSNDHAWINRISFDDKGRRIDAFSAYVLPFLQSGACASNLKVMSGITVDKILFDPKCSKASLSCEQNTPQGVPCANGVQYFSPDGTVNVMKASREVLLSAGPYHSPAILQRSGVGPEALLNSLGITTQKNAPVGQNTHSRVVIPIPFRYGLPMAPENNWTTIVTPQAIQQFISGQGGPLAVAISGSNARVLPNGFLQSSTIIPPNPDLGGNQYANAPVMITSCIVNPTDTSRGYVRIRSPDANVPLEISVNSFGSQEDISRALQCTKRQLDIFTQLSGPMKGQIDVPGIPALALYDDNVRLQFIMGAAQSAYHFTSGCAVGKVVSPWFYVKGIAKVRVVDASVIPSLTDSLGPMASTFILAEHAASLITDKYKTCLS